jgi:UDP-N-acetylmuramate--alanine ligase
VTDIHLMGIGGAGMSALARVLADQGVVVSGCDRGSSATLRALHEEGIEVAIGHDPAHLADRPEVAVSTAIDEGEAELVTARALGLQVRHRADVLADIVARGRPAVCVAGTHGKTTTSAMLAVALTALGREPGYLVGGDVPQLGSNARGGGGGVLVAEADESDGSLSVLRPQCAVVLNIEHDHHDHFPSLEAVQALFANWTATLPPDGLLVAADGVDLPSAAPVRRFGLGAGEGWRALDAATRGRGVSFRLAAPGGREQAVRLAVPGAHNAANAAAALAVLDWLGIRRADAAEALGTFTGAGRRFEEHGEAGGVRLVDDYAHHPTEITATLAAARTYAAGGRVLACFQPHMPWRTRTLQRELAEAVLGADAACVTEVYVARGAPDEDVSGRLVAERAAEIDPGAEVAFTPSLPEAADWLAARARPGDVIVTLGAGPVDAVLDLVRERLE